ncbi:hypothetical protein ACEZCY_14705 [Streptacidiphilus sp. N1-12]|uniref:Uncharacterized protein n=2 Tax=Streptacidiphilus alkalitolerans TaxID=3342712 RepID=A0ABV6V9V8_9ACTN
MNIVNIARGLLDRHEQIRDSDPETAAQIRDDLTLMADEVKLAISELRGLVDPPTIELEDKRVIPTVIAEEMRLTGRRLEELVGKAKRPAPVPKDADKAPARSTAAAAKAPEKA